LLILCFLAFTHLSFSQTYDYESNQDGNWSNPSTWKSGTVPPLEIYNNDILITHHVKLVSGNLLLQHKATVTVTRDFDNDTKGILQIMNGSVEVNKSNCEINLNFSLLSTPNGAVIINHGNINFNYGRVQSCNGNYIDNGNGSSGSTGIGTIYMNGGNVEKNGSGVYSSFIEWCSSTGVGINVGPENCDEVSGPGTPDSICTDEAFFQSEDLLCNLGPDTDGDGIRDVCDDDDDNDGIPDVDELTSGASRDTDGDGLINSLDIDSDNDGIPDNVEAQTTVGYIAPSGTVATETPNRGIDTSYDSGLALEDTDGDGIYDFQDSDSDNDGVLDIQENGDSDNLSNNDSDNDGLDNNFDSITSTHDANDNITSGTLANLVAAFGDLDTDASTGGDLDYRDTFNINPPVSATIDFDGVDDYLATSTELISGLTDVTMMGWVKVDPTFTGGVQSVMMGQDNLEINIDNYGTPNVEVRFGGAPINSAQFDENMNPVLKLGVWTHIAIVYNGTENTSILYINGKERSKNTAVSPSLNVNTDKFTIGKRANANDKYFKGSIDEVRIFDTNLTESQVQQMIYQEIEDNGGEVAGTIIPKNIGDINDDDDEEH